MESGPIATHERLRAPSELRRGSDRAFGLVFAAGFTIAAILPALRGGQIRGWCLAVAAVVVSVALVRPGLLALANTLWAWIGRLLHRLASPLVMGFIFYTTITPIGALLRFVGKDILKLTLDRKAATYWIERRPPGPAADTMRRQF